MRKVAHKEYKEYREYKDQRVDVDYFTAQYSLALRGQLKPREEEKILEVAASCMANSTLDESLRDFFESAFFILTKKNKRFIDVAKMNRAMRSRSMGVNRGNSAKEKETSCVKKLK